ncbi:TMV resistance protein N, putative [Ricinus communis]|uniref:ADP-ribosyl cyclase/cyclic ADP-ribose hydrolase n=1 Tax=Ricinus communis TaxID=3988 RepID=B9SBW2_RICCO|nr:TMV resistance protein N, putative [Ricinus communis]
MASSSSSASFDPQLKYDVFVSFRGEDTRDNFTSHLYAALHQKQIKAFVDDKLSRGEEISAALVKVIEESMVSVIIFSENYAFSPWCLDELVKILECKKTVGQIVLPVFYHVDPSDVAEQKGGFGAAFIEHEKCFKERIDKLQKWRAALTEAANISGWSSSVIRSESKLIQEIAEDILKKLNHMSSSTDSKGLVGINSRIDKIELLLCVELADVRFLGLWGMGGAGKTTTAEVVFNRISTQFDSCCFLANVNEESERYGLLKLQRQLFSKLLGQDNVNYAEGIFDKSRLKHRKVLIVLDDVNNLRQLENLAGEHNWFGPGSRIILTSRDKDVLKNKTDAIYKIEDLDHHEALQLFSLNAFRQECPKADYMKLSKRVINYAKGNPLGLKVLGSFLYQRNIKEWESALHKLERSTNKEIQNVLKVSYDGLDDEEKDIFLDVACFFNGEDRDFVTRILNGCGFSADIAISVLVSKSLLTISNNTLAIHNLLQQMGWGIVRQESTKEPGRRSRLCTSEDVVHVLSKNTGTEAIEGIYLDMSKSRKVYLSPKAFERMHNLRLLKFHHSFSPIAMYSKVYLPEGLESLPDKLSCLHWNGYPLKSLPFNFCAEYLVELSMPHSHVKFLWEGDQCLKKLNSINLSDSQHLIRLPDFSEALNLEYINLEGCISLAQVPSSIGYLTKLDILNLKDCKELRSIPSLIDLQSLRKLNLSGCSNLNHCQDFPRNIEELCLDGTAIEELPASIEDLSELTFWSMENCKRLDQNSCCLIAADAHKTIQRTATAAGIHSLPSVSFGFPGTEIPDWLLYKETGSSITVKLHPNWHRNPSRFLGFAVCCVVKFTHFIDINNIYVICECNFKTNHDDHHVVNCFLQGLNNGKDESDLVKSQHVYIGYDFGIYLRAVKGTYPGRLYHYEEVTFKFYAKKMVGHTVAWRKVDKCGVHLLYAQDATC